MSFTPLARHASVLGVSMQASRAEVTAAFRVAALRCHPDRGGCPVAFGAARAARDALLNELDTYGHIRHKPASPRMYYAGPGRSRDRENLSIICTVLVPVVLGVVVGSRLLYVDTIKQQARTGVRAGGSSRVFPETLERQVGRDKS